MFKRFILTITLSASLFFALNGSCLPLAAEEISSYRIRQEMIEDNGLLISRPQEMDRRIMEFMNTRRIQTLDDYITWLNEHITYQDDQTSDQWAAPLDTLDRGYGDCEDFAFLTKAFAGVLGYQPHVLALIRPGKSHAICVFKEGETFVWLDNKKFIKTEAKTWQELAHYFQDRYHYPTLLRFNENNRQWDAINNNS